MSGAQVDTSTLDCLSLSFSSLKNWAHREAYLRLAARESMGQPGVSPWYVDPAKIAPYLPTDEELGDMPIEI